MFLDQIMRYNVAQSWAKEFFGKFKCYIYVRIVPHYAT